MAKWRLNYDSGNYEWIDEDVFCRPGRICL